VVQGDAWLALELPNTIRFLRLLGYCWGPDVPIDDGLYAALLGCT
jgi:hypothetical protein